MQTKHEWKEVHPGMWERENTPKTVQISKSIVDIYLHNLPNKERKCHKGIFTRSDTKNNFQRFMTYLRSKSK